MRDMKNMLEEVEDHLSHLFKVEYTEMSPSELHIYQVDGLNGEEA